MSHADSPALASTSACGSADSPGTPRLRRTFGPVDANSDADMLLWAVAWGVQPAAIRQAIEVVGPQPLALSNYFAQMSRRNGGAQ